MTNPGYLRTLSDSQRQFVAAAEAKGAISPDSARPGVELPRISARELTDLLDAGVVREAAQGSYYVYARARPAPGLEPTPAGTQPTVQRVVKIIVFLIIVIVIPILFLLFLRMSNPGP